MFNRGNHLHHISLADLMDASARPGLSHLAAKKSGDLGPRTVLGQTLVDEPLQQILDAIRNDPTFLLSFLSRWIAPIHPCGKDLLRCCAGLVQGHLSVWADGVLAQLCAGAASAIQNYEYLAALGRDLDAKARERGILVDYVGWRSRQCVDDSFRQFHARHATRLPAPCYLYIT